MESQQEFDIHNKDFGVENYNKEILIAMFSRYKKLDVDIEEGKKMVLIGQMKLFQKLL